MSLNLSFETSSTCCTTVKAVTKQLWSFVASLCTCLLSSTLVETAVATCWHLLESDVAFSRTQWSFADVSASVVHAALTFLLSC